MALIYTHFNKHKMAKQLKIDLDTLDIPNIKDTVLNLVSRFELANSESFSKRTVSKDDSDIDESLCKEINIYTIQVKEFLYTTENFIKYKKIDVANTNAIKEINDKIEKLKVEKQYLIDLKNNSKTKN